MGRAGGVLVKARRWLPHRRVHARRCLARRARIRCGAMIRVGLVDDKTPGLRGLKALHDTAGDIAVVGEAGDGVEGATVIRRERPDVVLLDVRMPKASGLDLLRALRHANELPPTLVRATVAVH